MTSKNDKSPSHKFDIPMSEDIIKVGMVNILNDYNVEVCEDTALKMFYSIIAHLIYHLDLRKNRYFKMKYIDIAKDEDNLLYIRRGKGYTADAVNANTIYNWFASNHVIMTELHGTLDAFTASLLDNKKTRTELKNALDNLVQQRLDIIKDIKGYDDLFKEAIKIQKEKDNIHQHVIERNRKALEANDMSCFLSSKEYKQRELNKQKYHELEQQLALLWEQDNTQAPFASNC